MTLYEVSWDFDRLTFDGVNVEVDVLDMKEVGECFVWGYKK